MVLPAFQVIEHTVLCQHVREYPNGVKSGGESVLNLAVKQYKSLDQLEDSGNAVTIISTHANGFPKVRSSFAFAQCMIGNGSTLYTKIFIRRRSTSRFGKNFLHTQRSMVSRSVQSG